MEQVKFSVRKFITFFFCFIILAFFVFPFALINTYANKSGSSTQHMDRLPCSNLDYYSDSRYFRGTGIGTHANPRIAERMARLNANAQLSAGISVSIQSVTSRYIAEHGDGASNVYIDAFEQLSRQTTERHLRNIQIVCNNLQADNGRYTVYLAVEVAVEDVLFDLEEEFKKDDSIQHLYDKSMLKELFEEEVGAMDLDEDAKDP